MAHRSDRWQLTGLLFATFLCALPCDLAHAESGHLAADNMTESNLSLKNEQVLKFGSASKEAPPFRDRTGVNYILAEAACEEPYGTLPCSTSIGGNVFLMIVYGYLLFTAAKLISDGSELLLEVLNPGLIGGLLLPVLGAFPDSLLVLSSGLKGTPQEAQETVMVGIGVLAGSTIMILTVAWVGSLYAGRCDLDGPRGTAKDLTLTRPFDYKTTGVTTDEQTRSGAWIMVLSTLPFFIVQIPLLDGKPAEGPEAAVIGALVSFLGFAAYSAYQVASPWLQKKRIEEARMKYLRLRVLEGLSSHLGKSVAGGLLQADGMTPNYEAINKLFTLFDKDNSGQLDKEEVEGLILGLGMESEGYVPELGEVHRWFSDFDTDTNQKISRDEFATGIAKWAKSVPTSSTQKRVRDLQTSLAAWEGEHSAFWAQQAEESRAVLKVLLEENDTENAEESESSLSPAQIYQKAALLLLLGAAVVAFFADPMVSAIGGFSEATAIPPFFVAFVVTPFASNASELVSSILFAQKKRKRNISLTFSQIYGAISMNNTLCLGIFLALVYFRGLTWDFSSEVTVILISTFAMGLLGGSRTTFPTWVGLPVSALYPLSLATVVLLDFYLGWT